MPPCLIVPSDSLSNRGGLVSHFAALCAAIMLAGCQVNASEQAPPPPTIERATADAINAIPVAQRNGPYELVTRNTDAGAFAMTEVRALNNGRCAMDLGTTSTGYADYEGGLAPNSAFLVGESGCGIMQIKANSVPLEIGQFGYMITIDGNLNIPPSPQGTCPPARAPTAGATLCVDNEGDIWVTSARGVQRKL